MRWRRSKRARTYLDKPVSPDLHRLEAFRGRVSPGAGALSREQGFGGLYMKRGRGIPLP